jgi:HSP20 family protein
MTRKNYSNSYFPFDDMFFTNMFDQGTQVSKMRYQSGCTNVYSDDMYYTVQVLAPGYSKSDFDISVEDNTFTVKASGPEYKNVGKTQYQEFNLTGFTRSFNLHKGINKNNVNAEYDNGVLSVYLPYNTESKTRKITIS